MKTQKIECNSSLPPSSPLSESPAGVLNLCWSRVSSRTSVLCSRLALPGCNLQASSAHPGPSTLFMSAVL